MIYFLKIASEWERRHPRADLLRDLRRGFRIDRSLKIAPTKVIPAYADPMVTEGQVTTTTQKSSWKFWG